MNVESRVKLLKARELEKEDNIAQAADLYMQVYEEADEIWTAAKAGELFLACGNVKKAKEAFENIKGCENYALYDRLINFYVQIKDFSAANDSFIECYPLATKSQKMAFADMLFKNEVFALSEEWYLQAVEKTYADKCPYFIKVPENAQKRRFFANRGLLKADEFYMQGSYKYALPAYVKNSKNSIYCKQRAAECYFMLGDFENAKKYYRELVQQTDDAYYMFMLAECYNSEDIAANTLENAVYWYEYALENGCSLPYYHLGICYQFGRGVEENLQKAEEFYIKGLENHMDKANCLCKLGNICFNKEEYDKATDYYRQAAELNSPRALLNISIGFFEREITYFSYEEIRCFLAKSAALGSRRAYDMLLEINKYVDDEDE